MPSTIKLAKEYGDDLGIILVESQGADEAAMTQFAWDRKWMGTTSMWTRERPFNTGAKGIPNFALISASGKVIAKGNPISMHREIVDLIEQEIEAGKGLPEGAPKSLKKAYKAFGKGDLGKAIKAADAIVEAGGEDAEDAKTAAKMFRDRIESKVKRFEWLMENGYLLEAEELSDDLVKGTKGLAEDDLAGVLKTVEAMGADGMKDELKAAKAFGKLHEKAVEDGLDAGLAKKLEKFMKKHGESKVAGRAQALLTLAQMAG